MTEEMVIVEVGVQDPEELGRIVRDAWVQAVKEHISSPPESWVRPWESMSLVMQQIDITMGLLIAEKILEICHVTPDLEEGSNADAEGASAGVAPAV